MKRLEITADAGIAAFARPTTEYEPVGVLRGLADASDLLADRVKDASERRQAPGTRNYG